jgi:hypothetical protein
MWRIGATGFALYVALVLGISIIEWCFHRSGDVWVKTDGGSPVVWWDIVYFNFASILTIGYGDFTPNGNAARFVTILESVLGTGILGITLAALTAKFLSPPENAVIFSKHAYYCTDEARFLVIYLNTTRSRMVNVEISSYFKLGGDWVVRPAERSPFLTRSVQTFYVDCVPEEDLAKALNADSDALRFGISGQLGATSFSVAIEYKPTDIIVLRNRDTLTSYPGFWDVDLRSPEFKEMFHYRPANARTLMEHVEELRSGQFAGADLSRDTL